MDTVWAAVTGARGSLGGMAREDESALLATAEPGRNSQKNQNSAGGLQGALAVAISVGGADFGAGWVGLWGREGGMGWRQNSL